MAALKKSIHKLTHLAEKKLDEAAHAYARKHRKCQRAHIAAYNSFGTCEKFLIHGRLLEDRGILKPNKKDSGWANFLRTYKRFGSREIPFAKLEIEINNEVFEVPTDEEGYFQATLQPEEPISGAATRLHYRVNLKEAPVTILNPPETITGTIFLPPEKPDFIVVSDIDDTIMYTGATSLWRMLRTTFLGNAFTRVAFNGVAKLYQALERGPSGTNQNPIFYLSSSPWNLYFLLYQFLEFNKIPMGPMLLRDYGIDENKFVKSSHDKHKKGNILRLMNLYPDLQLVLIGDSGQHDTFIYHEIARDFPDRIKAIYIRDAKDEKRNKLVRETIDLALNHGIGISLVPDSISLAQHAADLGLIHEQSLSGIRTDMKMDELIHPTES